MYYENSHYEKKISLTCILSFIFKLCVIFFIIVLVQYFFPHSEDTVYYFQFEKINKSYHDQMTALSLSQQENAFTLQKSNNVLYSLFSTLPVTVSDSTINSVSYMTQNTTVAHTTATVLPLNIDCLVSSTDQSQKYGIIVGCSNGNIKIITPVKEEEQESLLYHSIDVQKPILMVAWEQQDIIVFALENMKDIQSLATKKSNANIQNSVSVYRFTKEKSTFQQESVLRDIVNIGYISKIYTIEDLGTYVNTVQGIELLHHDKMQVVVNEAVLQFAGGTSNIHVLQFHKEHKQYFTVYIGTDIYFTLLNTYSDNNDQENREIHVQYDTQKHRFILVPNNSVYSNYYAMVLKYE